jgi:hypothetical protein
MCILVFVQHAHDCCFLRGIENLKCGVPTHDCASAVGRNAELAMRIPHGERYLEVCILSCIFLRYAAGMPSNERSAAAREIGYT